MNNNLAKEVALQLIDIHAVKFGDFVMKSGAKSPIYFDLRIIVSYPSLLENVASLIWDAMKATQCDVLCGVPYTALPFATCISLKQKIPMVLRRKEAKGYGTKQTIEGIFHAGQRCVVVEDVVTSGSSVLETVGDLRKVGLQVTDAVVLLDREQGGKQLLAEQGITLHSVYTIGTLLSLLESEKKLDGDVVRSVREYLLSCQFTQVPVPQRNCSFQRTFQERSALCKSPLAKQIYDLMIEKKSNLCVSADLVSSTKILELADAVGPYIVILKTHADIIQDFDKNFICHFQDLAKKHKFLIFEDRKFSDIGFTVEKQYSEGVHKIVEWAHLVTAHALPGPGILQGLKKAIKERNRGCFLLVEMSSSENLINEEYKNGALKMAKQFEDFVVGVICQSPFGDSEGLLRLIPGVKLGAGGDSLGQQYVEPNRAVLEKGADIIIVGRGITSSDNPKEAAVLYQKAGFEAYEMRCQKRS